jgi:hypothetical protein
MAENTNNGVVKNPESASDEEKGVVTHRDGVVPHAYTADLPPDPDAHLSAEERAEIVRSLSFNFSNAH